MAGPAIVLLNALPSDPPLSSGDSLFAIGSSSTGTLYKATIPQTALALAMGPAGTLHAPGTVPDPGATSGLGHFLRDDATWAATPQTTISNGTTSLVGGTLLLSTGLTLTIAGAVATVTAAGGGGGSLEVTDGTTTLTSVSTLTISSGLTLSGSGTSAVLSSGGGGGGSLPANAALLGTNSGGTAVAQSVGDGLTLSAGTLTANIQTPPIYFSGHTGTLTASETVWRFVSLQNVPVPSGFTGWSISSKGTASSDTTLSLLHNGTAAATVTFSAGASISTIAGTGGFNVSIGDLLELQGPASPDTNLAQLFSSLAFGNVFATSILNPFDKNANLILSGGNLIATGSGVSYEPVRSAPTRDAGALYFEFTINNYDTAMGLGIANSLEALTTGNRGGDDTNCAALVAFAGGMRFNGTTYFGMPGSDINGDVICFAVNFTAKDIWVRVNGGLWNNDASADPAAGTHGVNSPTYANGALTSFFGTPLNVWAAMFATSSITVNFGGTTFAETVPAGYSAWQ
jgi:hypothetical protein